jgi:hypothetical protein
LGDFTVLGFDLLNENGFGIFQTNYFVWGYSIESLLIYKFDITSLDIDFGCKFDLSGAFLLIFRE